MIGAIMLKRFALAAPLALAFTSPATAQDAKIPAEPAVEEEVMEEAAPEFEATLVVIETTMGDITVALETERAPITAANFLRYADEDRFDGTVFYRAMPLEWGEQPNGLIQAGTQNNPDRILDPIAHERTSDTGILHEHGTLSMARFDPGTATGDFSIMLRKQIGMDADPDNEDPAFHDGYAAFGHVVEGMDVVEAIHAAPTDPDKGEGWLKGQMLAEPVEIVDVRRVEVAE